MTTLTVRPEAVLPDGLAAARAVEAAKMADRGSRLQSLLGSDAVLYPLSGALAVAGWYALILAFGIDAYLLPAPHDVLASGASHVGLLLHHGWVTLLEIMAAFVACVLVGVPLGIAIASIRLVDKLVTPLLVLSQGIPKIALAPVLLAWFGFGFKSNLAIGFLIAVFPVVVNTVLGLRSVDPALLRMGTSFGGAGLRLFRQVRLPAALPSIQAGMEIAVTFAAVGAIIGEFAAGSAGLGYLIQVTVGNLDMALGFAAIVCTALAGWITYLLVKAIGFILLRKQRAPR